MGKYGIDWGKENAVDGGFLDDEIVNSHLEDERLLSDWDLARSNFNARVYDECLIYDNNENAFFLLIPIYSYRHGEPSNINIIVNSEVLDINVNENIELPNMNKATKGIVKFIIPIENISLNKDYDVLIKFKDAREKEYNIKSKHYTPVLNNSYNSVQHIDLDYKHLNYILKNNYIIQYCYVDYTHGSEWYNCQTIEGIEAYQKEDGTWTSDVVANPEKYLKSDLDWYYSDERMVDYIEAKGLLPQDKIDAIRAANYEDIFSFEYKMKSAIKIIPIVLVMIIIAIIVIKKIRKRIF